MQASGSGPQHGSCSTSATPHYSRPPDTRPPTPASHPSRTAPEPASGASSQPDRETSTSNGPCSCHRSPRSDPIPSAGPTTTGNEPKARNTTPHSSAAIRATWPGSATRGLSRRRCSQNRRRGRRRFSLSARPDNSSKQAPRKAPLGGRGNVQPECRAAGSDQSNAPITLKTIRIPRMIPAKGSSHLR